MNASSARKVNQGLPSPVSLFLNQIPGTFDSLMRVADVITGSPFSLVRGCPIAMVVELCLPVCLERHNMILRKKAI